MNNNLKQLGEQLSDVLGKVQKECVEYLNNVLDGDKSVEFITDEDYECVYVPYDGGRHPEYATNVFSLVRGVFKKGKQIFVDIEDCCEYEIERLDTLDLYAVCCHLELFL